MQIKKRDLLSSLYSILMSLFALASLPLYRSINLLVSRLCGADKQMPYPFSDGDWYALQCLFRWSARIGFGLPFIGAVSSILVGAVVIVRHSQIPKLYVIFAILGCTLGLVYVAI